MWWAGVFVSAAQKRASNLDLWKDAHAVLWRAHLSLPHEEELLEIHPSLTVANSTISAFSPLCQQK